MSFSENLGYVPNKRALLNIRRLHTHRSGTRTSLTVTFEWLDILDEVFPIPRYRRDREEGAHPASHHGIGIPYPAFKIHSVPNPA